jgi:translation elongation factor EF-1alpha
MHFSDCSHNSFFTHLFSFNLLFPIHSVPNMIGGTAQADIGVLVISARKGEFETGFGEY